MRTIIIISFFVSFFTSGLLLIIQKIVPWNDKTDLFHEITFILLKIVFAIVIITAIPFFYYYIDLLN